MTANRISQLKQIIALEEKRADLQSRIDALEARIAALQSALYGGKKGKTRSGKTQRKGRGALREEILEVLVAAGSKGISVQEIASHLNTKPANIHSWFSINAKKIKGLKKIGEARYALLSKAAASGAETKAAKTSRTTVRATSKAKAKPAKAKVVRRSTAAAKSAARRPAKRGELKEQILNALKAAGAEGITIKDLSEKLNVKYKNLYIWFVTTGKRVAGLRKVAPARYALAA